MKIKHFESFYPQVLDKNHIPSEVITDFLHQMYVKKFDKQTMFVC